MNIEFRPLYLGTDPEFFFVKGGKVIGSEKVIPEEGIAYLDFQKNPTDYVAVVRDGIQGELHPRYSHCRQLLANTLSSNLSLLKERLPAGVKVSFAQTVEISEKEMQSLSPSSQQFGCTPSYNAYQEEAMGKMDASAYYSRSAGGHIHLGAQRATDLQLMQNNADHVIRILDIIVGNTCVLLDRNEGNKKRRELYGRAGEYRRPKHGLEYRVLSNFWMQRYTLMSLVFGLARFGVAVALDPVASKAFTEAADFEDIRKAINENDLSLAQQNFDKVKKLLNEASYSPLAGQYLAKFEQLAAQGLAYHFKKDPMAHWCNPGEIGTNGIGWETFASNLSAPKKQEPALAVMTK